MASTYVYLNTMPYTVEHIVDKNEVLYQVLVQSQYNDVLSTSYSGVRVMECFNGLLSTFYGWLRDYSHTCASTRIWKTFSSTLYYSTGALFRNVPVGDWAI